MRVYEIAKEVGIPNKDLIAKIRALGLEVNNHMSSLDADDVARIKRSLEKEKTGNAAPAPQKLSSGTVLRRRSSGDKGDDEAAPPARPVAAAPAPAIRRQVTAGPAAPARPRGGLAGRPGRPLPHPSPSVMSKPRSRVARRKLAPKHPLPLPLV